MVDHYEKEQQALHKEFTRLRKRLLKLVVSGSAERACGVLFDEAISWSFELEIESIHLTDHLFTRLRKHDVARLKPPVPLRLKTPPQGTPTPNGEGGKNGKNGA